MEYQLNRLKGFTLLEILIVIVILGIVTTFALLSVGDFGQSRKILNRAKQMVTLFDLVYEQSILENQILGVHFDENGYGFYRYQIDEKRFQGEWTAVNNDLTLRYRRLLPKVRISVKSTAQPYTGSQRTNEVIPQIVFFPSGNISPFQLEIQVGSKAPEYKLTGKYNGQLTLTDLYDKKTI